MLDKLEPFSAEVVHAWRKALGETAERIELERGIKADSSVYTNSGSLWVGFDDLRLRVGGLYKEVVDPDDLFHIVDEWVFLDWPRGPRRILERDRRLLARLTHELLYSRPIWEAAVSLVAADVEHSAGLSWTWRLALTGATTSDSTFPLETTNVGARRNQVSGTFLGPPELRLFVQQNAVGWSTSLPAVPDLAEASFDLARAVQEEVVDYLDDYWPKCPEHPHGMTPHAADGGVGQWVCPTSPTTSWPIGQLTRMC